MKSKQQPKATESKMEFSEPKRMSKAQIKELENSPAMKRKHDKASEFLKMNKFPDALLDNLKIGKYHKMIQSPSPFKFNGPVMGRQFRNRKIELQEIMTKLKGPALVFVCGYKGFGKTSFALNLSKEINEKSRKWSVAYASIRGVKSEMDMFTKFGATINGKDYGFDVKIANGKPIEIESCIKEIHAGLKRDGKEKALLIIDDFGIVSSTAFDWQAEELLEVVWKNRKWLSICVFLRNPTDLVRLFSERLQTHRPKLFQLGLISFLDELKVNHWDDYFSSRFKKNKQHIDKEAINYMMTRMNNVPRAMQHLAHYLFASSKPKITKRLIDNAIQTVVDLNQPSYETKFSKLNKLEQSVLLEYVGGKPVKVPMHRAGRTWEKLQDIITIWSWKPFFLDPYFEYYLKMEKVSRV